MSEDKMLLWIKQISLNLKFFRKRAGLNQKQLAEKAGVNYRYYQDIETAKVNPTMETLLKLSHALDISADDVVSSNYLYFDGNLDEYIKKMTNDFNDLDFRLLVRDDFGEIVFTNNFFQVNTKQGVEKKNFTSLISNTFADSSEEFIEHEKNGYTGTFITSANQDIYFARRIACHPFLVFNRRNFKYLGATTVVLPEISKIKSVLAKFQSLTKDRLL